MLNKSVARRYAEAFFKIAQETGQIDKLQQELENVVATINGIDELKTYLNHLLVPVKQKKEIIDKIFSEQLSAVTVKFLKLVVDKRREGYLDAIVGEYCDMADESRNIIKAYLFSAQEVPEDEVKVLQEKLSASTGKTVELKQTVDESLIGGIKIRVGDRIIDASVTKKLEMLQTKLQTLKIS
ncbi:MAG: F0F1 ATP synthase subunit delta [Syntrophomonadaceae bacterium]|jgi:F-type H+-transporting ATPase subunit delta|nr:F0F1 ATP synthase subunit delta [Syntrophomonadaceae bacterium]